MAWLACLSITSSSLANTADRAVAEELLKPAGAIEPGPATAEAIAHANQALERATRLRVAGDEVHAKAAEGVAREWAETARDLGLAAAAERLVEDRKRQAIQAQAQLQRTKALVEETIARLGRLRAALDAALASPKQGVAVEAHDGAPKSAPGDKRDGHEAAHGKSAASPSGTAP